MTQSKVKVLLVEDNLLSQIAEKMILQEEGCEVDVASTCEEAIQFALNNLYTLIFVDIGLDDTDGFKVTEEIRSRSEKNRDVPVIALTAYSDQKYKNLSLRHGMECFITKPLTVKKIQQLLLSVNDKK